MIVIPDMMRTDHHNGLDGFRLVYGVLQYFSYNVTVSFIGGGNQSIRRKPLTYHKSLTKFIT